MNTAPIDGMPKLPTLFRDTAAKASNAGTEDIASSGDGAAALASASGITLALSQTPPVQQKALSQDFGASEIGLLNPLTAKQSQTASQNAESGKAPQSAKFEATPENMTKLREMLDDFQKRTPAVQFNIDKETGDILVKVVDRQSGKVVRQIPPDEILAMQHRLDKMRGLLFHGVS